METRLEDALHGSFSREERSHRSDHEDAYHGEPQRSGSEYVRKLSQRYLSEDRLPQTLGWFSIGLGLAAVAAPRQLSRIIGLGDHILLLRLIGVRELASGVGILSQRQPTGWLWSRVAGDIMDLAMLTRGFENPNASRGRLTAATAAVAGVTALDFRASMDQTRNGTQAPPRVAATAVINRPPEEVYRYWRNFEYLPRFMEHLETVEVNDEKRSHWVARGPAGKRIEWDAELTEDRANELIAWRSLEGSSFQHAGSVQFRPQRGGRGTLIRVEIEYRAPAGTLGTALAKLSRRAPDQEMAESLRRLKQLMEAGEILTTDGQPAGRARSTSWKYDHAVLPAETATAAHL
jgi:uncharacterized membrane protein